MKWGICYILKTFQFGIVFFGKVSRREKDKFVKDIEKQEIARKISSYASSNPLEFVAEAFSAMLSGVKLPEKVMEMYKAFGGPNIPKT